MSGNDKIKISDFIVDEIHKSGVDTFFGVTGGAVVHLFDSVRKHAGVEAVFFNHEQAASFAVESYAKSRRTLGAGIFTTGPGATNALTGLTAAWLDSVPCIFVSGQARASNTIGARKLRQVGTQEVDIVQMVKPVTNYAVTIRDIREVKYHLHKALYLARHGRPGPVWIDIPVDFQWTSVDPAQQLEFDPAREFPDAPDWKLGKQMNVLREMSDAFFAARRPLILVGYGVRLGGAEERVIALAERLGIPVLTSWSVCDLLPSDHALNLGRPGIAGQRGANLGMQNCDFLLCLGSHLNNSITGTRYDAFAREAKIAVVDVDREEIANIPVHVEYPLNADINAFLDAFEAVPGMARWDGSAIQGWRQLCDRYRGLNRIAADFAAQSSPVSSYYFKDYLSRNARKDSIFVVDGGGTNVYSSFQSCLIGEARQLVLSTGLCAMGSGIPESIGIAYANPGKEIYCFVGDGSFPFNMQELQLIRDNALPIKIFVLNNRGYVSIRSTQQEFLEGAFVGSAPDGDLHLPDVEKVAGAFGLPFHRLSSHDEVQERLPQVLGGAGPLVCEVMVSPDEEIVPRQGFMRNEDGSFSPRPLEDMYPFLDRDTYKSLMVVAEWNSSPATKLGREVDLLRNYPRSTRLLADRGLRKLSGEGYIALNQAPRSNVEALFEQFLLKKAREFGEVYFDGDRLYGYGGYTYNKKYWYSVARDIIEFYGLKDGDKVLDVGCAKGFLLHDLKMNLPGLQVFGVDISQYAIDQSIDLVKENLPVTNAASLPFPDGEFDLVISVNTLSELDDRNCRKALREIRRVSKRFAFVTVSTWNNEEERQNLLQWNVTGLSNHSKADWLKMFAEEGYTGDYCWVTISGEKV